MNYIHFDNNIFIWIFWLYKLRVLESAMLWNTLDHSSFNFCLFFFFFISGLIMGKWSVEFWNCFIFRDILHGDQNNFEKHFVQFNRGNSETCFLNVSIVSSIVWNREPRKSFLIWRVKKRACYRLLHKSDFFIGAKLYCRCRCLSMV